MQRIAVLVLLAWMMSSCARGEGALRLPDAHASWVDVGIDAQSPDAFSEALDAPSTPRDAPVTRDAGCTGQPDLPCGSDVGACTPGVQRCVDGTRTTCEGAVGPSAETCDGEDDDCDMRIDEGGVCPSCPSP